MFSWCEHSLAIMKWMDCCALCSEVSAVYWHHAAHWFLLHLMATAVVPRRGILWVRNLCTPCTHPGFARAPAHHFVLVSLAIVVVLLDPRTQNDLFRIAASPSRSWRMLVFPLLRATMVNLRTCSCSERKPSVSGESWLALQSFKVAQYKSWCTANFQAAELCVCFFNICVYFLFFFAFNCS